MTMTQMLITVAVVALGTMITRFLPFAVFSKRTPGVITYLGKVLPVAVFGLLVVYCLKNVTFSAVENWLPQLISIAVVVILHLWKRQTLLSMAGGTVCYMLLVQLVF